MNTREFKCVKILTDLIENEGLIGIKTSFEDEGALFNETIRLKEICNQAKTKITLKIGGPEAIRDIKDSLVLGVKGLVAPMVESSFGVKKFIQATKNNVPEDVLSSLQLNVNVETINGVKNINEIIQLQEVESLYGITVGRVDLVSSMNKDRSYVNSDDVLALVKSVFSKVKERGLKACLGGAISVDSLNFLKSLQSDGLLDKFETRYAIFDPAVTLKNLSRALAKAQMFEYE
ncbi:MAG: citrate lyase beta subunit, partial [Proteobacteria bacterium]|nr:citrate lyase beta subunit [Pseudomonadota bacterium]